MKSNFIKAVFGSCKSISGKYPIFRKGKCFHVFGCILKKFSKNIFWCLEKKKEKTNPEKKSSTIDARLGSTARCFASSSPTTAQSIAIQDRDLPGAISWRRDLNLHEIAIDSAISRRHDLAKRRSWSRIAVVGLELVRLARTRARSSPAIVGLTGARSSPLARSLSLSLFFWKYFEVKMEV